jgi:hypothetical protein
MKNNFKWWIGLVIMILASCQSTAQNPADVPHTPATSQPISTLTPIATRTSALTSIPLPTRTQTQPPTSTPEPSFSFIVTSDMSYTGGKEYIEYPNFFAALLGYVKQFGPGAFMISPGDVLPADQTRWTIDQILGEDYLWFPVPGNHDFGQTDLEFLQNYDYDPNGSAEPNIVHWGPESCPKTTYSFDYQNAHFVALNVYCNEEAPWGIDGSITDILYDWLAFDLASTDKEHIFVFGHEPAFPQPDDQTGHLEHFYESLDQYPAERDRFWQLLGQYHVVAYINGHTHGYSSEKFGDVWQLDAGHAMGTRAAASPGTFLIISIQGGRVSLQAFRGEAGPGFGYLLWEEIILRPEGVSIGTRCFPQFSPAVAAKLIAWMGTFAAFVAKYNLFFWIYDTKTLIHALPTKFCLFTDPKVINPDQRD